MGKKLIRWLTISVILIVSIFGIQSLYLFQFAKEANLNSSQKFFQQTPDLIAVYTGDTGRIRYSLSKYLSSESVHLLISGVYIKNSTENILKTFYPEHQFNYSDLIEIDHEAESTIGNVINTLEYLKRNPELKKTLIISSDYHLFRIRTILNHFSNQYSLPTDQIFYSGIESPPSLKTAKLWAKETFKIIATYFVLLFWDFI